MVKLLVEREDVAADSEDIVGRTPLSWAARGGHEAVKLAGRAGGRRSRLGGHHRPDTTVAGSTGRARSGGEAANRA